MLHDFALQDGAPYQPGSAGRREWLDSRGQFDASGHDSPAGFDDHSSGAHTQFGNSAPGAHTRLDSFASGHDGSPARFDGHIPPDIQGPLGGARTRQDSFSSVGAQSNYTGTSQTPLESYDSFTVLRCEAASSQVPGTPVTHQASAPLTTCSGARDFMPPAPMQTGPGYGACELGTTCQAPPLLREETTRREVWDLSSVLEVFSASAGLWFVATIIRVGPDIDVLTSQFYTADGPKQKSLRREDPHFAELGVHTVEIPPSFRKAASASRPGAFAYIDAVSGAEYGRRELAWQVHFERIMKQPMGGMETLQTLEPQNRVPLQPVRAPRAPMLDVPETAAPDLASWYQASGANGKEKVALPSFGGAVSSQAAYLHQIGSPGPASVTGGSVLSLSNQAAYLSQVSSPGQLGPLVPSAGQLGVVAACGRTASYGRQESWQQQAHGAVRLAVGSASPWQQDPFSDWRGGGPPQGAPMGEPGTRCAAQTGPTPGAQRVSLRDLH